MDDPLAIRIKEFYSTCSQFFKKINDRISYLNAKLNDLDSRVAIVRDKIDRIQKDTNKSVSINSPAYYPIDGAHLEQETLTFDPRPQRQNISKGNAIVGRFLTEARLNGARKLSQILSKEVEHAISPLRRRNCDSLRNKLESMKSISSLLIHSTYESRVVSGPRHLLRAGNSFAEESSTLDHASRKTKPRSHLVDIEKTGFSSSRWSDRLESDSDLGPVPDSILRYQERNILDLAEISIVNEDESDPITADLPDVLPTLKCVVLDVQGHQNVKSAYLDLLSETSGELDQLSTRPPSDPSERDEPASKFLSDFEPLFKPLVDLPPPDTFTNELKIYPSQIHEK